MRNCARGWQLPDQEDNRIRLLPSPSSSECKLQCSYLTPIPPDELRARWPSPSEGAPASSFTARIGAINLVVRLDTVIPSNYRRRICCIKHSIDGKEVVCHSSGPVCAITNLRAHGTFPSSPPVDLPPTHSFISAPFRPCGCSCRLAWSLLSFKRERRSLTRAPKHGPR